jgi:hypothetical protein
MSNTHWKKIDIQKVMKTIGIQLILENAPPLLYSKKDKEHTAYNSLIAFLLITAGICFYVSISLFLIEYYFNIFTFTIIILILGVIDLVLLFNYMKSNVYIKPIECWFEVYQHLNFYCFSYYPIFSGKCLPNRAKDLLYKLFKSEVLNTKIDVQQIELYVKLLDSKQKQYEKIGFFFQYGKGYDFREEKINRDTWNFFPYEYIFADNFIAVAHWDHQFQWKSELSKDHNKLNEYSPWIIKRWNKDNLKPLTEEFKENINWNLFNIDSMPKLKPWENNFESYVYKNPSGAQDLEIIDEAIDKVMGQVQPITKLNQLEKYVLRFKIYFRDLNL